MVLEVRTMQQFRRPENRPATNRERFATVFSPTQLAGRDSNNRSIAHLQRTDAVSEILGEFALNEHSVHAVVVQAVVNGRHFIVVNDAQQWMQLLSTYKPGIVVWIVNFQYLLHTAVISSVSHCKDIKKASK